MNYKFALTQDPEKPGDYQLEIKILGDGQTLSIPMKPEDVTSLYYLLSRVRSKKLEIEVPHA